MKTIILAILFSAFCYLSYNNETADSGIKKSVQENKRVYPALQDTTGNFPDTLTADSIGNRPQKKTDSPVSDFFINAVLDENSGFLKVSQKITWRNNSRFSTGEMYFHLYPNAYKSSRSIFMNGRMIPLDCATEIQIGSFRINGKEIKPAYVNTDVINRNDSTVIKVTLDKNAGPGDSVAISCEYRYRVPKAYGRMGYTPKKNMYFFGQWFIKPGVFENGKWICSPMFPEAEFYSDFSNYNVGIDVPASCKVFSSGVAECRTADGRSLYSITASRIHDFAWSAVKDFRLISFDYLNSHGSFTHADIVVPPGFEKFSQRYKWVLRNSFNYFDNILGAYPYSNFTMIVAPPNSGRIASMEYPCLTTVSHSFYTAPSSLDIEKVIVHEFAHQYFYGMAADNESYEGWLDEGIADYLTSRMLDDHGLQDFSRLRLFGYLQIKGLELMALGEIPLIYSVSEIAKPNLARSLGLFYDGGYNAALSDSSYLLTNTGNYAGITYGKAELFFKTFERLVGRDKMLTLMKELFNRNRYRHFAATDLFPLMNSIPKKNFQWYINDYYKKALSCDYSIDSISNDGYSGTWVVSVRRNGEAFFPCEVSLYTATDTITKTVINTGHSFTVQFRTAAKATGAEIDMRRKNFFDTNFANNSYLIESRYAAPWYFSARLFYWIQSFLLIFGSLA